MRFIDEARVRVSSGKGGDGWIHFRREKFVPRGGPDGGDGGNGGAVIFVTDTGLNTLVDFAFKPLLIAEDGSPGDENGMTGADGADYFVRVPVGTQVFFGEKLVADINAPGARWVAAKGGRGGKGNFFFRTPTEQAPSFAQRGQPGEEYELTLILKSVADVGLVGLPNVGKSTLISRISGARPKVADYPFTTLTPSLGAVIYQESRFVVADIPGLIPGAHTGKGLGLEFLKHIERTKVIAHLIDPSTSFEGLPLLSTEPSDEELLEATLAQFEAIENELKLFSEELIAKPRLVIFSKGDLELTQKAFELAADYFKERALPCILISSVTGLNLDALKGEFSKLILAVSEEKNSAPAGTLAAKSL